MARVRNQQHLQLYGCLPPLPCSKHALQKLMVCFFQIPDGAVSLHITIIGFVDDTTVITGGSPSDPVEELLKKMERGAQL